MRSVLNWIMNRRARRLAERLRPHFPSSGRVADVGSGTGHNIEAFKRVLSPNAEVVAFDVADLHWVGPAPLLFDGRRLPAKDNAFSAASLLFVLQYSPCSDVLLREVSRVTNGPVLVVQSSYRGWFGFRMLSIREFFWGRFAFRVAVALKALPPMSCPLEARNYYRRQELIDLAARAGLRTRLVEPSLWSWLGISRDLLVLERRTKRDPEP